MKDGDFFLVLVLGLTLAGPSCYAVGRHFSLAEGKIDGAREAGAIEKCWKTARSDRECRMVCPGFDPFKSEEVK